jgi:L-ascorbate metabolism protein UlaG (beta-lactamase superfamily)
MSSQAPTKKLTIQPSISKPPTRDNGSFPSTLPPAKETKVHPNVAGNENASLFFVGTATTILEWAGVRLMTDPNFLHAGDHVHLGPGVTSTRRTNPAVDLHDLPRIDMVLLSHYHADHFDQLVENSLRRDLPIVTTPHAKECLVDHKEDGEKFTAVTDLDFWESCVIRVDGGDLKGAAIKVTGMPGKHVPPGPLNVLNELLHAVPPTNGWMLELGHIKEGEGDESFTNGYRIYISGDTLLVDELKEIPKRYKGQNIDLMLIHLGGTTIPSPSVPLLMVTMDAEQGIKLVQLIQPDITIPIHYE